jgi:hypothetical protein
MADFETERWLDPIRVIAITPKGLECRCTLIAVKAWMLGLGAGAIFLGCGPTKISDPGPAMGGAQSGSGGSGGIQTGSGGASGGLAGSGGAPPAQAGLLLQIRSASPAIPGKACNVTALTKTVPDEDPYAVEGPTTTTPGERVVDGEQRSQISCTVSGDSLFDVTGSIEFGSTSFVIMGEVTAGSTGSATVSAYTPDTGALTSPSTNLCTIDVSTSPLQVDSGAIWASFDCPTLETPPSTACGASGVFILENCEE